MSCCKQNRFCLFSLKKQGNVLNTKKLNTKNMNREKGGFFFEKKIKQVG